MPQQWWSEEASVHHITTEAIGVSLVYQIFTSENKILYVLITLNFKQPPYFRYYKKLSYQKKNFFSRKKVSSLPYINQMDSIRSINFWFNLYYQSIIFSFRLMIKDPLYEHRFVILKTAVINCKYIYIYIYIYIK